MWVGIAFEHIKDTVVKNVYTKNELKLTSITNLYLWVGIVFEPIKDIVVKTIYTKKIIKNYFNNKPLSVGGYSI